jgi:hypothetical protein
MRAVMSARPASSTGLAAPPAFTTRLSSTSGRSWNSASTTSRPLRSLKRLNGGTRKKGCGPAAGACCRKGASGVNDPGAPDGAAAAVAVASGAVWAGVAAAAGA